MQAPLIRSTRILAYHGVDPAHPDGLTISVDSFRRQIAHFAERGWRLVPLNAFCAEAHRRSAWPEKLMGLTFDDGYRDCWQHVQPILREFGFAATVFVISDTLVPGAPRPLHCPAHKEFLSGSELKGLMREGWEVGSHTCNHARLPVLPPPEQARQLAESKRVLETELAVEVTSFCYPAGKFTPAILPLVAAAGYKLAPVTPWARGLVNDGHWLTLERVGIYRADSMLRFRMKMSPLFHWLRKARFGLAAGGAPISAGPSSA